MDSYHAALGEHGAWFVYKNNLPWVGLAPAHLGCTPEELRDVAYRLADSLNVGRDLETDNTVTDEDLAKRLAETKRLTDDDPYKDVPSVQIDPDDGIDDLAGRGRQSNLRYIEKRPRWMLG